MIRSDNLQKWICRTKVLGIFIKHVGVHVYSSGVVMSEIWVRERQRRLAIWQLAELQPGDRAASEILQCLDELERLDREFPLCDCHLDMRQLAELPSAPHPIGCWIIKDDDIPEPWRTRFSVALGPASRVAEGFYRHDWHDFLDAWECDIAQVECHREALSG